MKHQNKIIINGLNNENSWDEYLVDRNNVKFLIDNYDNNLYRIMIRFNKVNHIDSGYNSNLDSSYKDITLFIKIEPEKCNSITNLWASYCRYIADDNYETIFKINLIEYEISLNATKFKDDSNEVIDNMRSIVSISSVPFLKDRLSIDIIDSSDQLTNIESHYELPYKRKTPEVFIYVYNEDNPNGYLEYQFKYTSAKIVIPKYYTPNDYRMIDKGVREYRDAIGGGIMFYNKK